MTEFPSSAHHWSKTQGQAALCGLGSGSGTNCFATAHRNWLLWVQDFNIWTQNFDLWCTRNANIAIGSLLPGCCCCCRGRRKCSLQVSDAAVQVQITAQSTAPGTSWETQGIPACEHKTRENKCLEIPHLAHELPGRNQVQHITAPLQDLIRNRFLYISCIADTGLLTSAFHNTRPECQTSPKQPEAREQGWATEIFLHDAGSTADFIFFAHCQRCLQRSSLKASSKYRHLFLQGWWLRKKLQRIELHRLFLEMEFGSECSFWTWNSIRKYSGSPSTLTHR